MGSATNWICQHSKYRAMPNGLGGISFLPTREVVAAWPGPGGVTRDSYGREYKIRDDGSIRRYRTV